MPRQLQPLQNRLRPRPRQPHLLHRRLPRHLLPPQRRRKAPAGCLLPPRQQLPVVAPDLSGSTPRPTSITAMAPSSTAQPNPASTCRNPMQKQLALAPIETNPAPRNSCRRKIAATTKGRSTRSGLPISRQLSSTPWPQQVLAFPPALALLASPPLPECPAPPSPHPRSQSAEDTAGSKSRRSRG